MRPHDLGRLQAKVLDYIRACGLHGATDDEIQFALDLGAQTQTPRRYELAERKFIKKNGRQRLTRKGRFADVWVVRR